MGTRHLIAVYKDGALKVAQYGQFDGYLAARGVEMLDFLNDHDKLERLRAKVDNCFFSDSIKEPKDHHRRNHSVEVLTTIADSNGPIELVNSINFAKDGLFCEWAYVIDLDTNTFEVFKGFSKKPVPGRFGPGEPDVDGYYPVAQIANYSLDHLPSKDELLALGDE